MDEFAEEWSKDETPAKPATEKVEDSAVAEKAKGDADYAAEFTADDVATAASSAAAAAPASPALAIVIEAGAPAKAAEPAKAMSFKETFAAQRKAGAKTFDWNGKKYTTELAAPKAKPKAAPTAAPTPAPVAAPAPAAQKTTLAPAVEGERKPLMLDSTGKASVDVSKQTGMGSLKL